MVENSIVYRHFKGKYEYFPMSRAEGSEIWDKDDKRYIDFTSGWNVTNLGWNHPEVNQAVAEQTKKNTMALLWGSDPIQEEYAEALTTALPESLDACAKETGGTESIEVSIKVVRTYTKRKKVIGFDGLYHGQLFAALALAYSNEELSSLAPLVPDITPVPFPHEDIGEEAYTQFLAEFENILSREDVAAVVTEPGMITGAGSTLIAYPGFLTQLRALTEKYGTLLIVDEVGTGFSRTGKLFGIEHEGVTPDMVVCAKGISNGAGAIGTVVGKSSIFEPAFTDSVLISTFGWTPLACAAALKTLHIHQRDKVWEMAEAKGAYIVEKLSAHVGGKIVGVRGRGMEIGIRCTDAATAQEIRKAAFADGLHMVVGSQHNLQLMPPITISQKLLDEGLDILTSKL